MPFLLQALKRASLSFPTKQFLDSLRLFDDTMRKAHSYRSVTTMAGEIALERTSEKRRQQSIAYRATVACNG